MAYSADTILRALYLRLGGMGSTAIVKVLKDFNPDDTPTAVTILKWDKTGELLDGIKWSEAAELIAPIRKSKLRKQHVDKEAAPYEQFAKEAKSNLDLLLKEAMASVGDMEFRPADVSKIIESRQKLEQSDQERVDMLRRYVTIMGHIMAGVAGRTLKQIPDQKVPEERKLIERALQFFLDRVAGDFEEFIRNGILDPSKLSAEDYVTVESFGIESTGGLIGTEEA